MNEHITMGNQHLDPLQSGIHKTDIYTSLIRRVFRIDDVTWGDEKSGYLARYRGELLTDSEAAYDMLRNALRPFDVTPIFRVENGQQTIKLLPGVMRPKPSKTWVNILLFSLTFLSMLYVGTMYTLGGIYTGPSNPDLQTLLPYLQRSFGGGVAFTLSMLAILLSHEFGHYFVARYHKTAVSLPYFLPFPNLLGTMGAIILTKEVPKNKKVLLDIGIAGPLAGFIVTIPILFYGLATSQVHHLPDPLPPGISFEGNSLLYLGVKYIVHGQLLPQPADFGDQSPLLYWIRYFFTGTPLPHGGIDVTMNSVALAGWAGLLITGLNLIPVGQLDGGHLLYGIMGKRTQKIVPFIIVILMLLGLVWSGWWLWALLILVLNRRHGEPLDEITPLDTRRKLIAILGLLVFILVFIPVPMTSAF